MTTQFCFIAFDFEDNPESFLKQEETDRKNSILLQSWHIQSNAFDRSVRRAPNTLLLSTALLLRTLAFYKTTVKFRKNIIKVV